MIMDKRNILIVTTIDASLTNTNSCLTIVYLQYADHVHFNIIDGILIYAIKVNSFVNT